MKKYLALALVIIIAVLTFVGCSGKGEEIEADQAVIVGYRFSLIDSEKYELGTADIYHNSATAILDKALKATSKHSKVYLARNYVDIVDFSLTTESNDCILEKNCNFASSMPYYSLAEFNATSSPSEPWYEQAQNIDIILAIIGCEMIKTVDDMTDESIMIEPILALKVKGQLHLLTPAELALFGTDHILSRNADNKTS